jgi:hypothetical protein
MFRQLSLQQKNFLQKLYGELKKYSTQNLSNTEIVFELHIGSDEIMITRYLVQALLELNCFNTYKINVKQICVN